RKRAGTPSWRVHVPSHTNDSRPAWMGNAVNDEPSILRSKTCDGSLNEHDSALAPRGGGLPRLSPQPPVLSLVDGHSGRISKVAKTDAIRFARAPCGDRRDDRHGEGDGAYRRWDIQ